MMAIEEKIQSVLSRAKRLIEDAEILINADSFDTAVALAILAIEEISKAHLFHWQVNGYLTDEVVRSASLSHLEKQRVYCAMLYASIALGQVKSDFEDLLSNKVPHLVRDKLIEKMQGADFEPVHGRVVQTEIGFFDLIKQGGFYIDVDDEKLSPDLDRKCTRKYVESSVIEAKKALQMFEEPLEVHAAGAAIYKLGPQIKLKGSKKAELGKFLKFMEEFQIARAKGIKYT